MGAGERATPKRVKRAISAIVTGDGARLHESGAAASLEAIGTEIQLRTGWTDDELEAVDPRTFERLRWRIEAELVWTEGVASYYNAPPRPPKHLDARGKGEFYRNRDVAQRIHSSLFPEDD